MQSSPSAGFGGGSAGASEAPSLFPSGSDEPVLTASPEVGNDDEALTNREDTQAVRSLYACGLAVPAPKPGGFAVWLLAALGVLTLSRRRSR